VEELTRKMIETIRDAAKELKGAKRRAFEAQVCLDYLGGDPRLTETVFGWSRHTVAKGLEELRTGRIIPDAPRTYKPKTEDANPQLAQDLIDLVNPHSQTDPKFQGLFQYTRITAKAVRTMLIEQKGYASEQLPHEDTLRQMLDRMGYKMRRVLKAKPKKKIKETDAIFENVHQINAASDAREDSLRVSIDTKAILKLGELSRRGKARGQEAVKAQDKDMDVKEKLVPFGILEIASCVLTIIFGTSRETSDFLVDCLELWWAERKATYGPIRELVINLDNGPGLASRRTQFVKRMIEFADRHQLEIHLVYYPPYHSKYNPIERGWGILENHWNGTLLTDRTTAIEWAKTMTWKGVSPIVKVLEGVYETGVKVAKKAFRALQDRLARHQLLPKWDVVISPQPLPDSNGLVLT
jgi:hypothetical protein